LDKLYADGKIYKKIYNGWFCTPCETFWSQTQSSDGVCPDCKRQLQKLDESNYFFKTSEYQSWLISHIKDNPDFIKPDFRKNEVLGFLNEPLQDLCISRPKNRMAWGIEMPFDREFVTYVWFDALLNYISGIGYPRDAELFKKLWPCDVHVIGKDILRHHAVYWPIILKAIGIEPPRSIFAHGWWVLKGEKMSKSKGNVIDPVDVISKYGLDAYRYFLLREVPFGLDGTFSEKALINRYNSDLANDIGNLLSRTLAMLEKYFGGAVPDIETGKPMINPESGALKAKTLSIAGSLEQAIPALDFSGGLSKIWEAINSANKFIEDSKPWALAKEKKTDLLKEVVYTLVEVLRISAIAVYPVMPSSAKKIWESLGQTSDLENVRFQEMKVWGRILRGTKVKKSNPLFPRIEKS
jgi:methionyl-tRNA synthetase